MRNDLIAAFYTVKKQLIKRLLFVGTLPPPVHGSAVVCQQIKDSKLINDAFDCDWVNLSTSRRMDEIGKTTLAKPFRLLGALCKEFWLLLTHRYDLCYLAITCHGSGFLKDSPFVLLAKLFRKKIVIHQHNKGMANDVDRWPYRWLLPLCYKNAKVILLSWYLYPDIEKIVPKENVVICPNGIRVQEFKSSRVQEKAETNRVPRLLFLSNLIESKGVFVLLDALKILKDKGYSFICDFVGGETKEIDAKRFAEEVNKRGLNELAIYQGKKNGEEKEKAIKESDIFVLPTYYSNECFPLVNLEAMAHKKPIVSTNEGGIPDVIKDGENGLIAERKDSESLALCIEKLLDCEELRRRMGEDGDKKLKEAFTEEKFEANMLQIVNEICASGGGRINVCIYHGRKYGEPKQEMLSNSNIFVLPTMNDCFPLVLLEAMENCLPVVTTSIGGVPDIVDDEVTGLIAKAGDEKTLASCLEKLIGDGNLREKMGKAGRNKLINEFTEEVFEQRMKDILCVQISS